MAKRKAADSEPASSEADHNRTATPTSAKHNSKKQKIDWATIDDTGFDGFVVKSIAVKAPKSSGRPPTKKQKNGSVHSSTNTYKNASFNARLSQKNPFEETELSEVHCKIEPAAEWESTQRYRRFTINGEEFEIGQVVFVKKIDEPHDTPDAIPQWFAKVLEVRGGDPAHVYLRVFWAYRPEDLPGGRQPHHGQAELIVSNHMDVIEALTVESVANVIHWDDNPENSEWPALGQLFWRQSFDINKPKGKQLSKLATHCIEKTPSNPDEPLVCCPSCKKWLHARCLEEQALKEALTQNGTSPSVSSEAKTPKKANKPAEESSTLPCIEAKLSTSASGKTFITITDKRKGEKKRQWKVDITCLLCGELIEKAEDVPSQELANSKSTIYDPEINGHESGKTENNIIVPTIVKSDAALESEDKDSVISHDAPSNGTQKLESEAQVVRTVRGRGRPRRPEPTGKPGRPRKSTSVAAAAVEMRNTITEDVEMTTTEVVEATTVVKITPAPAQPAESVFQAGLNSVKKLLWRTT